MSLRSKAKLPRSRAGFKSSDVLVSHLIADRQLMAAFGAAAGQHVATIFGCHARAEAVLVDSFPIAGLERSFHDGKSILR